MNYIEIYNQIKDYIIINYPELFILDRLSENFDYYKYNNFFRINIIEIYLLNEVNILNIDIIYHEKIENYLINNFINYSICEDSKYKGFNIKIKFDQLLNLQFLFDLIDFSFPIGKEIGVCWC